jgi:uncharacterized alkaline shock family protein YloU
MGSFLNKLKEAYKGSERKQMEKISEKEDQERDLTRKHFKKISDSVKERILTMAGAGISQIYIYILNDYNSLGFSGRQSLESIECFGDLHFTTLQLPDEVIKAISSSEDYKIRRLVKTRIGKYLLELLFDEIKHEGVPVTMDKNDSLYIETRININLENDNEQTDKRAD